MRTMNFVSGLVTVSALTLANQAISAEAVKISTEIEVGAEYHFQLLHTDDGLKADGAEVEKTDFLTRAAKLSIRGKLTDQISWNMLYQLDKNLLERFWLTNKVSDTVEVNVGKQKIRTFGWNRKLQSAWNSPIRSSLQSVNPLTDALAVEINYKMFGAWSLAFVKDYFDTSATCNATATSVCKSWNEYDVQKQPAVVFEYVGSFGDIQPLVQYASYDRNHSWTASAGVRAKNDTVDAFVEYIVDERNDKGVTAAGKSEDRKNTRDGIVVYGEFFTGSWTPYAMFSTAELDQWKAPGAADIKTNKDGAVDDNEQIIAAGVFYEGYTKVYRPYVGVASTSGKYVDPKNTAGEEDRSKFDIMLGLTGKF